MKPPLSRFAYQSALPPCSTSVAQAVGSASMGSVMTAARSPGIVADRRFYMGAAAALVGVTFIGFAPSYYLANAFDAPAMSPLVHLHGIVFSTWMLLFFGQTWLIAARRADLHRIAGMFGAGLAVVMVVLGIAVAIESGRLGHGPPTRNQPAFLIQPLADITLFAALVAFGVHYRARSGYHKRLMLLATMMLAIAPLTRIARMTGMPFDRPVIGGMLLADIFLVALIAFDLRNGRLHPVTLWAGGIFLLSQPLRMFVGQTAIWQDFARTLIG
jgi:hypothetical protein